MTDLFAAQPEALAEQARYYFARIMEETTIPADKRNDLGWLRSAVSLAHVYAKAGMRLDVKDDA